MPCLYDPKPEDILKYFSDWAFNFSSAFVVLYSYLYFGNHQKTEMSILVYMLSIFLHQNCSRLAPIYILGQTVLCCWSLFSALHDVQKHFWSLPTR